MFALENEAMRYISTNNISPSVGLMEAAARCIAPDGGLYIPDCHVPLPAAFLKNLGDMNLRETAYAVLSALNSGELSAASLKQLADYAFATDAPLVHLKGDVYVLELFHGNTLTFKDYGARFLSKILQMQNPERKRIVLVASVGNSGAATAAAFSRDSNTQVIVLFPRGVLSRSAKSQFVGLNVHAIELMGTIEDCKRLSRAALADRSLAEAGVTAANSVNIGRLIPQIVFAFHAYGRLLACDARNVDKSYFAMPCGNLSNLTAAVLARRMGLPIGKIVAACNINMPLKDIFLHNAERRNPVSTLAPSMDVTDPSSRSRLVSLYGGDEESLNKDIIVPTALSDREIAATLLRIKTESNYSIDPHGAAAAAALGKVTPAGVPQLIYATSHPAKNLDIMTRITGQAVELPVQLTRYMSGRINTSILPPTLPALKKYINNIL